MNHLVAFLILAASISLPLPAAEPPRVHAARASHSKRIADLFKAAHIHSPAGTLLLRAFKQEGLLELWAGESRTAPLKLITTYPICARSGGPGPKERDGDEQVPEGFYQIAKLNPWSNYHLSLQIDYPNQADRARAHGVSLRDLGGEIFIHGNCVTIGCIPIEDGPIEELYLIAQDAHAHGATISAHLFPARPGSAAWNALQKSAASARREFWTSLESGYDAFEATHLLPRIESNSAGNYLVH